MPGHQIGNRGQLTNHPNPDIIQEAPHNGNLEARGSFALDAVSKRAVGIGQNHV
jgi:hypothetical protein